MYYTRNRLLTRVGAPASEPVTLEEAKIYMRIDNDNEDALIGDLIVAARMTAEEWLKRSLITQSWKLSYDDNCGLFARTRNEPWVYDMVRLSMGPVTEITDVSVFDREDNSTSLDSASYYLNASKDELVLTSSVSGIRVEISFDAGYGDAGDVPRAIKQGMLAHIASMYDNRGSDGDMALPDQTLGLYFPFREVRL